MPNEVIDRIRNLARQANTNLGLSFTDRHGQPVEEINDNDSDNKSYDPDYDSDADSDADDDSLDDANNNVDNVDPIPIAGVENDENDNNPAN
jgi:hypothetical protein